MCYINDKSSKGPYRAEKDVECFKSMDIDRSDNTLYPPICGGGPYRVGDTIHCRVRKFKNNRLNAWWLSCKKYFDGQVVHAYVNSPRWPHSSCRAIVRCVIPKGSYYWTNSEEIVAFDIQLKEIVQEPIP